MANNALPSLKLQYLDTEQISMVDDLVDINILSLESATAWRIPNFHETHQHPIR